MLIVFSHDRRADDLVGKIADIAENIVVTEVATFTGAAQKARSALR
jgi:hypothetical protein